MHNQVLPSIESVDGSDPLATLQNPMARLEAKEEEDEDEDEDSEDEEEEDGEDTDLDDWEPDPPRPFDPHDLCKWSCFSGAGWAPLLGFPVQTLLASPKVPLPVILGQPGREVLAAARAPIAPTSGCQRKPGSLLGSQGPGLGQDQASASDLRAPAARPWWCPVLADPAIPSFTYLVLHLSS